MPVISDYLLRTTAVLPGLFVRLINNVTAVAYIADAATDANGKFTFSAQPPPPGTYTMSTSPTGAAPWTATGDTNYIVPVSAGDDVALKSLTLLPSSPYAVHAGLAPGFQAMPYGSSVGISVGPTSLNLQARGADMSGAVAADAIWTAALAELPNNSGQIYVPPGTIKTTLGLDSPAQSAGYLSIRGAGKYATTFVGGAVMDHVMKLQMPGEVTDCTVDGGGLTTNGLECITAGSIAISEMAARRVRCRNIHPSLGMWLLVFWDTAQIWQIDRCYMDDVDLESPSAASTDAFTVSFVKKCFWKNGHMTGLQRSPNFFYILDLEIDGLNIENTVGSIGLVFDSGVQRMRASRIKSDASSITYVKAQEARFSDCTFLAAVRCGIASFPTDAEFHNCTIVGNGASAFDWAGLEIADPNSRVRVFGGRLGNGTQGSQGAVTVTTPASSVVSGIELHGVTLDVQTSQSIVKGTNSPITLTNMQVDNCRGYSPGRAVADATITNTSAIVTSSQEGQFSSLDVGRTIAGPNIPGATTVLSVQSATQLTMSAAASGGGGTNQSIILGDITIATLNFVNSLPDSTCRIHDNIGYNPVGVEVVGVPASTVAVAAVPYDRYYYIATGAGATTIAIQNGPTITLQASTAGQQVFVPAGKTLTPTYANAPTWVVEGN